ncbi:hypothetical protein G6F59_015070 [Rhizopus arrhizus]|uniref:Uncharacterized protein n=1 Tax=Rhizopus oryzae TaxID=64495 RepID=A0A9P6XLM8_RHIOR|nr:hypothetical protein G6F59_015070 [Rhizopus arrhizus]KAG1521965.1 hypothetical protein G6F51_014644 [Rhizopus arrhizus]
MARRLQPDAQEHAVLLPRRARFPQSGELSLQCRQQPGIAVRRAVAMPRAKPGGQPRGRRRPFDACRPAQRLVVWRRHQPEQDHPLSHQPARPGRCRGPLRLFSR